MDIETDIPSRAALEARVAALEAHVAALEASNHELRAERSVLQEVLDHSPDVIVVKDHEGQFLLGNKTVASLYGTTPEAMVGKQDGDFSATPEQAEFFRQNVLGIMARGETEIVFEDSTDEKTGETRHFKSIKKPFSGPDGKPRILVIAHDITDVRAAQRQVAISEQRLAYVLAATGEGVWDWDLARGTLAHNERWYQMLGYAPEDLTGAVSDFERCLLPEESDAVRAAITACRVDGVPYRHEHGMLRKDGRVIRVLDRGDVVERAPDGTALRMVGSFADVTEQVEAREIIRRSLHEKEILLKEIHHRVKNNLQIISALLTMQADGLAPEIARPLLDSVGRVRSMALIHRQLYMAENFEFIDLGAYARQLVDEVVVTLGDKVEARIDADAVQVGIHEAVPCGLILNELITNALKHGRSPDGRLDLTVTLRAGATHYEMHVRDHGPGWPPGFDLLRSGSSASLGMKLVAALVRQLSAKLESHADGGAHVVLRIPNPSADARATARATTSS